MEFRGDDRGVTVQIGAVLLFGILIIALATLQTTVVPDENASVEFQHNLDAQDGMIDVRNAIHEAGSSGDPASASFRLGTTYPDRTFLINPPPARGTLQTVGTGDGRVNVTLTNAVADSEYENAEAYWNGTARTYDTGVVVYSPNYNEYREAPVTVYEHSVIANTYEDNRTLERTGQTLVRGNRINLLAINGALDKNGVAAESVDARPPSASENTVTVTSNASSPLWLNFTSRLTADTWRGSLLRGQNASRGGSVEKVVGIENRTINGETYHVIGVKLTEGTYELRGASVAVGAVSEENKQPQATYFVVTDGYDTVGNQSNRSVRVQVRDQFNNPVSNASVAAETDGTYLQLLNDSDAVVNSTNVTTDADGYATIRYRGAQTTETAETGWLNVSILEGGKEYQRTNFSEKTVPEVALGTGGDGESDINPGSLGTVLLEKTEIANGSTVPNEPANDHYVWLNLSNTGSANKTITYARINTFNYQSDPDGYPYEYALFRNSSGSEFMNVSISEGYAAATPSQKIPRNETTRLFIKFQGDQGNTNLEYGDWFVLTVIYEEDGKQEQAVYIVFPESAQ